MNVRKVMIVHNHYTMISNNLTKGAKDFNTKWRYKGIVCRLRYPVLIGIVLLIVYSVILVGDFTLFRFARQCYLETETEPPEWFVPFKSAMDKTADPCEDFYNFTCGNWRKYALRNMDALQYMKQSVDSHAKHLFTTATTSREYPRMVNAAIRTYGQCKIMDIFTLLKEMITMLGGCPFLGPSSSWRESTFSWEAFLALSFRMGYPTVFNWTYTSQLTHTKKYLLNIGQVITSPMMSDAGQSDILIKLLYNMGIQTGSDELGEDVYNLNEFQERLRKLSGFEASPRLLSVSELQKFVPGIDWMKMLKIVTTNSFNDNNLLTPKFKISIGSTSKLKHAINAIKEENKRTVGNFLCWNMIQWFMKKNSQFFNQDATSGSASKNVVEEQTKEEQCYSFIQTYYKDAIGYLYVKGDPIKGEFATNALRYTKNAMSDQVLNASWMDVQSRTAAMDKIRDMTSILLHSKKHENFESFSKVHGTFPKQDGSFTKFFINFNEYFASLYIHDLFVDMDPTSLAGPVYDVRSTKYFPDHNVFFLPQAICHPPMFHPKGAHFLNFGSYVGAGMARTMARAFIPPFRGMSQNNLFNDSWTKVSISKYNLRVKCFKDQYSGFRSPNGKHSLRSNRLIDNNLADSMGIQVGYQAYALWKKEHHKFEQQSTPKNDFTDEQMLFISYASTLCTAVPLEDQFRRIKIKSPEYYSPDYYRMIGSLQNSYGFAKAFKCRAESRMNPSKKCSLW